MSRASRIAVALMITCGGSTALVLGYGSLYKRPPTNQIVLHIEEVSPNGDGLLVDAQPAPLLTLVVKSPSDKLTPGATVLCSITKEGDLQCGDALLQSAGCILLGEPNPPATEMAENSAGGLHEFLRSKF